jgi:hypothetical protein
VLVLLPLPWHLLLMQVLVPQLALALLVLA